MKKIIAAILIGILTLLTGCGAFLRPQKETTAEPTGVQTESNIKDLADGGYYILKSGDVYEELYAHHANFEIRKNSSSSSTRTLWFKDDWDRIPTMYTGDSLVFKTSSNFDETFILERFEYVGYTVGLTGLSKLASGRFSFSSDPEKRNINPTSDANALYAISTSYGVIDRIGEADLREGNISSGGCILGLEKGKKYLAEVYEGTFLHEFTLTADSIALTSMEYYSTVEYDFMRSETIEIHIPDYFNSGYYLVNGYGLVRYVNDIEYDSDTNFNIPNIIPSDNDFITRYNEISKSMVPEDEFELIGAYTSNSDFSAHSFVIEKASSVIITIEYSASKKLSSPDPTITILSETKDGFTPVEMQQIDYQTLRFLDLLEPGVYRIEIRNMMDRQYIFEINIQEIP